MTEEKQEVIACLDENEEEEMVDEVVGEGEDDEEVVLPPEVVRRVKALKRNTYEVLKVETEFFKEMHKLECKYLGLYKPLHEKRSAIVNGLYEPDDAECDLSDIGVVDELTDSLKGLEIKDAPLVKGVPQFWTQVFTNVEILADLVQEHDLPILKKLTDIQVEIIEDPTGFKLHFHFEPNEYFSNTVLTKTYFMKIEIDKEDPFSFEGPEIVKCTGCTIDWNKGKNVTVKTVKKKQKHKQRGSIRTVVKTVEAPSFFNFFNPPKVAEDTEEMDPDTQLKLTNDFEIGQYIRENIIPRAVLYFTGEALEEEEDDFDMEEEEEEEDEDEDDGDEDDEPAPRAKKRAGGGGGKKNMQGNPPECKQQ